MKYIVLLGDGMADKPIEELGGKVYEFGLPFEPGKSRFNINKEIDIHLRKALGILNDNEMKLDELVTAFKKEGKKLNRVLGKASKMKKAYTDQEREDISKLNKCLVDLMTTLKSSNDASYVATVKRLIQAFTSLSKVVAKIVEGKSGNKTVQEGEE